MAGSDGSWNRHWFNPVVNYLGGPRGWFGLLYVPTLEDEAAARARTLDRRLVRLEADIEERRRQETALERRIKRLWAANRQPRARDAVRDLRRARVSLGLLSAQRRTIEAMRTTVEGVGAAADLEATMAWFVSAMERANANPRAAEAMLGRYLRVQEKREAVGETFAAQFAEEEEAFRAADEDADLDEEALVTNVLVELGCLQTMAAAPSLVIHGGGASGAPGGGGGGDDDGKGGRGPPPMLRVADDDARGVVVGPITTDLTGVKARMAEMLADAAEEAELAAAVQSAKRAARKKEAASSAAAAEAEPT